MCVCVCGIYDIPIYNIYPNSLHAAHEVHAGVHAKYALRAYVYTKYHVRHIYVRRTIHCTLEVRADGSAYTAQL